MGGVLSFLRRPGRPGGQGELDADEAGDEHDVSVPRRLGLSEPMVVRLLTLGLWGLVVVGALAGSLALASQDRRDNRNTGSAPAAPGEPADVMAFAELFVGTFVNGGDAAATARFTGDDSAAPEANSGQWLVWRTAAAGAREVSSDYWDVLVGAAVMRLEAGVYVDPQTRFFSVGVMRLGGKLVVTAPPAMVAGPSVGSPPRLAGGVLSVSSGGDDVTVTVERGLNALLAGTGELERYAAAGSGLVAVDPPPFDAVMVERSTVEGTGEARQVRVQVRARRGDSEMLLAYSVELGRREGRWELERLSGAPPLADPEPTAATG